MQGYRRRDKGNQPLFTKQRGTSQSEVSRILVNTGGSFGGTGASTGLMPSFTLGCGTWGGSSVSENVTPMHLLNIKKVAYGLIDCDKIVKADCAVGNKVTEKCNTDNEKGISKKENAR